MKKMLNNLMQATKKYTLLDFAVLKIASLCAGILIGVYLVRFFTKNLIFVWVLFGITYLYILIQTFVRYKK